jgi:general secretion pathway protein G
MKRVRHHQPSRGSRAGFTLMEVLLVLAILGVIIGLVLPNLIGSQKKALMQAAQVQIKGIEDAAGMYAIDHGGTYPTSIEALVNNPGGDENWKGPYLKETQAVPADPWGSPVIYQYPGSQHGTADRPDISSYGPDKQQNTADDITNWKKT